jgi:hypothetical protein
LATFNRIFDLPEEDKLGFKTAAVQDAAKSGWNGSAELL